MHSRGGCATVEHLRALALVRQDGLSHSSESRTAGLSRLNESCATDPPRLRGRTSPSEVAPRPPRAHSTPEVAPRSPNRDLALRVHIPSSEPESRFSSLNRASRIRIPLPGLAFRSSGSRSTPWIRITLLGFALALRIQISPPGLHSALRTRIPLLQFTLCSASRNAAPSAHARPPSWNVAPLAHAPLSESGSRFPDSRSLSEPEFRPICQALEAALPHFALPAPSHLALPAPDVSRETFVRT